MFLFPGFTGFNGYFSVPLHTPIILTEGGSRTLLRLQVGDARRETEDLILQDMAPEWLVDVVVHRNLPKFIKIPFYLLPHSTSGIKPLRKDKLSASDMLQVRKVMEHVYQKMLQGSAPPSLPPAASSNDHQSGDQQQKMDTSGVSSKSGCEAAADRVELLCQDQVLDPNMDLRTVKHFIWKSGGELVIHYRPLPLP